MSFWTSLYENTTSLISKLSQFSLIYSSHFFIHSMAFDYSWKGQICIHRRIYRRIQYPDSSYPPLWVCFPLKESNCLLEQNKYQSIVKLRIKWRYRSFIIFGKESCCVAIENAVCCLNCSINNNKGKYITFREFLYDQTRNIYSDLYVMKMPWKYLGRVSSFRFDVNLR